MRLETTDAIQAASGLNKPQSAPRFLSGTSAVGTDMDAIREMYARWAAGDMGEDDQWGDVTAEPRGLDYAEVSADGVQAMWLVPHGAGPDAVIVALHGGGFVGGSRYTHRKMYGHLAKAAGVRVLLATYRLAPQFRYPAQIEDAVTAYRWAATRTRTVVLAGDSSGGGLAVQVALRQPGAAALLLLSPWIDMDPAQTATSYEENAATDLFFTRPMVQGLIPAVPAGGDQRPGAGGQRLPRRPVRAAAGVRAVRRRRERPVGTASASRC